MQMKSSALAKLAREKSLAMETRDDWFLQSVIRVKVSVNDVPIKENIFSDLIGNTSNDWSVKVSHE